MHAGILSKCIEELKAETPDISYIRGALETLLAVTHQAAAVAKHEATAPLTQAIYDISRTVPESEPLVDEEDSTLAAYLGGPTGTLA